MSFSDFFDTKSAGSLSHQWSGHLSAYAPSFQIIKLLFRHKPHVNTPHLLAELKTVFGNAELAPDGSFSVDFMPEYTTATNREPMKAAAAIMPQVTEAATEKYINATNHAWHWPDAAAEIQNCRYEICLQELMPAALPAAIRLEFFQKFAGVVISACKPAVVYFGHSHKLVDACDFLNALSHEPPAFLYGAMSVRLIPTADGKVLADTLGLNALGLPDFECLPGALEPAGMAGTLTDLAYEMLESNRVISDNELLQAPGRNESWKTRLEPASNGPDRLVIKLLPA
ncbi:DUF4261 domain-containing protein [Emticicia sp. TH156]|uniref:DUF4261 domain-containing protein n=1 Tax=Emticicia sp. TH156 TaxID=2067454 RepID=UPI000C766287|nr:DUF4261 domain-containing protein [Emticicia sp. TH156]PLK44346.1 hypothetical protein C0V77_11175 [Emticicia sp. TH156]